MIHYIVAFIILAFFFVFIYKNKRAKSKSNINSQLSGNRVSNPLIYGFAVGYNWNTISLFVASLRNSGYKGDILMVFSVYNYNAMKNELKLYNVKPILISNQWPFFSSTNENYQLDSNILKQCLIERRIYNYKWNIYRFSILDCWLLKYGNEYSHIFSLDVRDVVFQKSPSELYLKDGVYLVEETRSCKVLIKDDACNLGWLKNYKDYEKIINNKILNSGTIFGSNKYFIEFIKQFCQFLKDNYINTAEQGTLNYVYYSGYFRNIKININRNQKDIVLTTGLDVEESKLLKIENNSIINKDGSIPYIIHQYDRYDKFIMMFREKNNIK